MQELKVQNAGLYTAPNPFSAVPPGAMVKADNLVIDSQGVLESRRGIDRLSLLPDSQAHATRFISFQNKLIAAYNDAGTGSLAYYNGSSFTAYSGNYNHPDAVNARLRFLQAASNLYITTNAGIFKLDAYTNQPVQAGMYKGLDLTATSTGGSGFLSNGTNFTINGYLTSGSALLQQVPNTAGLVVGYGITGSNIPANTTISAISGSTITLSQNASGSSTTSQGIAGTIANSTQMYGYYTSGSNPTAGMFVSGPGVTLGTTVAAISASAPFNITLSQPATLTNVILTTTGTTNSTTTVSGLASTAGIVAGSSITTATNVSGSGIPAGTYVSAISGTSITLSASATSSVTGVTLVFFTSTSSTQFTFYDTTQYTAFTGNQSAYRMLWGITDANNNVILGAPSGRAIVTNNGTTSVNVSVTFSIPSGVTTSHFYQIYRTLASGFASVDPGDNEQLVFEGNPTSGQISAGTITITDVTPDSLLGTALYTNASQQGIQQSNYQPPLSWDFANFRTFTFYANTISKQRLTITLLAAGGTSGVAINDTITIAGVTYTAKSSQNAAAAQFQVFTSGTPAQNIANTAQSLVQVINQYSGSSAGTPPIYATYQSGVTDLPGIILLEERGIGGITFAVTASAHGSAWNPQLPTSGTSVSSSNNQYLNGLAFAKAGQPEAVPLVNQYFVGSAAYKILRILPLQNSLLILKEVEGVYRLTGYDPSSFIIDLVDSSTRLLAPDSAVVLNNQVWGLTDQGVTTITDTGSGVMSRPVEDQFLTLFGQDLSGLKQYSSGINYDTDRKYILLCPTGSADISPTQAFVYNTFTRAFTRWPISKTCGYVNPTDDKLYLGDAVAAYVNVERKTYSYLDFVDEGVSYTITSFSGNQVFLTTTNQIQVGARLFQSSSVQSLITQVQPGYVVVQDQLTWSAGAVTVYSPINCLAEWTPISISNPGTMKQCPEISMIFKSQAFNSATLSFGTDVSPSYSPVTIMGNISGLWGLFPWGTQPWGGAPVAGPVRTLIPLEKQRCSELRVQFQIQQGFSTFQLLGMSLPVPDDQTYAVAR